MKRMARREFLARLGLAGAAAVFGPGRAAAEQKQDKRLNFVFILADDLGWLDVVCYARNELKAVNRGVYETPNIDRLAGRGMMFTDAYAACPVCSPTRASIMTGKYPARLGLTEWIPGKRSSPREKIVAPKYLHKLPLAEVTLAEVLKRAGYRTGHVGKWHLGGKGNLPEDQGFDVNVAGTAAGSPAGGYFLPNRMNLPGAKKGDYLTDRLTEEGLKFIEANKDKTFFLYQSYHSVHTPIQAKKAYVEKYRAKLGRLKKRANPAYAGMVQSLDEGVGRIVKKLDDLGIADRTVVFFMSDNGGLSGVTNNAPLRAGKGHVYEGGIREPMIVFAPGITRPGGRCVTPVSSVDFYPTILELAGAKGDPKHEPDGVSLAPLLKGQPLKPRAIYWHYPHYSPQGGRPAGAVRSGKFKLMQLYEDDHVELYDLTDDIGERNNLAETMPEKAAEMHKMLRDWLKAVGARMPGPNPNYRPGASPKRRPSRKPKPSDAALPLAV